MYSLPNAGSVVTALSNFANITLSSLYFDITKDPLYCDGVGSMRRRSIVTVLEKVRIYAARYVILADISFQVLDTMVHIMAPILPHLAEEVYQTRFPAGEQINSAFSEPWKPLVSSVPLLSSRDADGHRVRSGATLHSIPTCLNFSDCVTSFSVYSRSRDRTSAFPLL